MRGLLIALVVANLLVLAWSLDWLPGMSRSREREPERLRQQVRPEAVQLITPTAASAALQAAAAQRSSPPTPSATASAPTGDPSATVCLEAGPFAAAEVAAAERGLRELKWPSLEWTPQRSERGGSYIVYLGRFADDGAMLRRRDDLRRQQVAVDEVRNSPDLQPGLQFGGRHDTRASADAALAQLVQQGVKAARVATITLPVVVTLLRVERADGALAARLTQLNLPPAGAGFRPCAVPP
jgi:hypothetical protein